MLSLRNALGASVLSLTLISCGFEPVYKEGTPTVSKNTPSLSSELKHIAIKDIQFGRAGQKLQTTLSDLFNPTGVAVSEKHRLDVTLSKRKEDLLIEQDREVTRYRLNVTANFKLVDSETGKPIYTDTSRISGSYDAVESDYSTYTAETDTLNNIMHEIAQDIRVKLTTFLLQKRNG